MQILARNSFGNAYITIGDLPAVSIQNGNGSSGATVYGSFAAEGTSHVVAFKMGGSGASRYVSAVQVRDLGAAVPPEPIIGCADGERPIEVGEDEVRIRISNAVAGRRYGYRKSTTLAALDGAATGYPASPDDVAAQDGPHVVRIPRDPGETCAFYRIVAEY